jgi:hypothetical protein
VIAVPEFGGRFTPQRFLQAILFDSATSAWVDHNRLEDHRNLKPHFVTPTQSKTATE